LGYVFRREGGGVGFGSVRDFGLGVGCNYRRLLAFAFIPLRWPLVGFSTSSSEGQAGADVEPGPPIRLHVRTNEAQRHTRRPGRHAQPKIYLERGIGHCGQHVVAWLFVTNVHSLVCARGEVRREVRRAGGLFRVWLSFCLRSGYAFLPSSRRAWSLVVVAWGCVWV
jgi:hypothetical protein